MVKQIKQVKKGVVVHYASSSNDGAGIHTPRIISIVCSAIDGGEPKVFSLISYLAGSEYPQESEALDRAEQQLLEAAAAYLREKIRDKNVIIHWGMNSSRFGFHALRLRSKRFSVEFPEIDSNRELDLYEYLVKHHGADFEKSKKNKTKFLQFAKRNGIPTRRTMHGKDEGKAADNGDYSDVTHSCAEKVRIIRELFLRARDGVLEFNEPFSVNKIKRFYRESLWMQVLIPIVAYIVGVLAEEPTRNVFNAIVSALGASK